MNPITNDENTNPAPTPDEAVTDAAAVPVDSFSEPVPQAAPEAPAGDVPAEQEDSSSLGTDVPLDPSLAGSVTEPTIAVSAPIADQAPLDLPAVDEAPTPTPETAVVPEIPATDLPVEAPAEPAAPSTDGTPTPDPTSGAF